MAVILNNEQKGPLPSGVTEDMERIASQALSAHDLPAGAEISVIICDNLTIRELNHKWRSVDRATDVLSFPLIDDFALLPEDDILLGDIIISLEQAQSQAAEYGHSLRREVLYLFVHGVLHLLGYDHEQEGDQAEMRQAEEEILAAVGALRDEF
jgi:probable rRNA maturation factor